MESKEYRESRSRRVWIIIAAALLMLCGCSLAAGSALVSWFKPQGAGWGLMLEPGGERAEEVYRVGRAPALDVDSHAGNITVRAGRNGEIRVVATREIRLAFIRNLPGLGRTRQMEVEMVQQGDRVIVRTRKPLGLGSGSVGLEITAPRDTSIEVDTGAGNVYAEGFRGGVDAHSGAGSVRLAGVSGAIQADSGAGNITLRDVAGEVRAHSGAGSIDIEGGEGAFRLDTGTGSIGFEGKLRGDSRFHTGAGSIMLRLPGNTDLHVELETGVGAIHVGFPVAGTVTKYEVRGVIGSGRDGSIWAGTGTGGIDVVRP